MVFKRLPLLSVPFNVPAVLGVTSVLWIPLVLASRTWLKSGPWPHVIEELGVAVFAGLIVSLIMSSQMSLHLEKLLMSGDLQNQQFHSFRRLVLGERDFLLSTRGAFQKSLRSSFATSFRFVGAEGARQQVVQLIRESTTQITLQGMALYSLLADADIEVGIRQALERGVHVRVLVVDPRTHPQHIGTEEIGRLQTKTLDLLESLQKRYAAAIEIRVSYESKAHETVLVIDKRLVIEFTTLRPDRGPEGALVSFLIIESPDSTTEKETSNSLYDIYMSQLESSWSSSIPTSYIDREISTGIGHWDVFLCHSYRDQQAAERIGRKLKERGITALSDHAVIRPGLSLEKAITDILGRVDAVVVLIGSEGSKPWQDLELRALLASAVQLQRVIVPVFLPGVDPDEATPTLPAFLRDFSWVRFSQTLEDPTAIDSLFWAITGLKMRAGAAN